MVSLPRPRRKDCRLKITRKFDADTIRQIRAATGTQTAIAERFGTTQAGVSQIKVRRSYSWVGDTPEEDRQPGPMRKLDEAKVLAIRNSDETDREAAQRYGVSDKAVRQLRTGHTWRHVGGPIQKRRRILPMEIREALRSDLMEVARLYGVSFDTIRYHSAVVRDRLRKTAAN